MLIEMADMRETNRSYEANVQVVKQARGGSFPMTIDPPPLMRKPPSRHAGTFSGRLGENRYAEFGIRS